MSAKSARDVSPAAGKASHKAPAGRERLLNKVQRMLETGLARKGVSDEELRQWNDELVVTREALNAERRRYQELFEFAPDGYLVTDADGIIREANRAAALLFAVPENGLVGLPMASLVAEGDRAAFEARLGQLGGGMGVERIEFPMVGAGSRATPFPASITVAAAHDSEGRSVGLRWLVRDITDRHKAEEERRRFEARLQHAQRLESLGTLAGGIAHDFNNILTGILGNAELAADVLPDSSPVRENIEGIRMASLRAAELVGQMLAYSGRGRFLIESLNLNDPIREMAELLGASISKKAVLRFDFAGPLPLIEGDATQIRQVAMNLITNASEALGDREGEITVSTGVADATTDYLAGAYLGKDLPGGRYVYLRVSDTGCGMDAETQGRIFDPFFTTKFAGRGLGLSAVIGIVRAHHGTIKVASTPGAGTTIEALFPVGEADADAPQEVRPEGHAAWQGQGTLLIVDDDDAVRKLATTIVARHGFQVLTAADGREGVEVFRRHAPEIDAVILDLTMPRMGGEEALAEMRRIRADAKFLLISGYGEAEAAARFAGQGLAGFLQKPFLRDALLAKLREVMGQGT